MALRVWLPLNGDLHNQGLSDIEVTNNGATFNSVGKLGGSYNFNGSSNYLTVPQGYPGTNWSYSVWVYTSSSIATQTLGCCRTAVGTAFSIFLQSGKIRIDPGGKQVLWITNYTYPVNTWFHFTVTCNNGAIKYYINGEYKESYSTTLASNQWGNIFSIGASQSNGSDYGNFLSGKLNDVRIYDHCLSPLEVKKISQGLVLHYRLSGIGGENLLKNSNVENNHVYDSNDLIYYYFNISDKLPTGTYTLSFDIKSSNGTDNCYVSYANNTSTINKICELTGISNEWIHYKDTFTNNSTNCNNIFFAHYKDHGKPFNSNNTGIIYVKNVKLEKGSHSTPWCPATSDDEYSIMGLDDNIEYDCSGFGNNGEKIGDIECSSDTPRYSGSYKFDGASYIKNINFPYTLGVWSVSLWYRFDTIPTGYQGFISLSKGNGADSNKKMAIMPNKNYIWYKFENQSGQNNITMATNKWTHLAITCDGVNGRVYINGVLSYTSSSITSIYSDCTDLVIGARSNADDVTSAAVFLNGNMSDVRIYTTALSADDVLDLYRLGGSIDSNGVFHTYEYMEGE